jgi:hypothetical protein
MNIIHRAHFDIKHMSPEKHWWHHEQFKLLKTNDKMSKADNAGMPSWYVYEGVWG